MRELMMQTGIETKDGSDAKTAGDSTRGLIQEVTMPNRQTTRMTVAGTAGHSAPVTHIR